VALGFLSLLATACGAGGNAPPPPPVCDQECPDNIALRALRETMRFAYNRLLQGNPVGAQDEMSPCPLNAGTIHIFGNATSDDSLGTTQVDLTFDFQDCATRFINVTPERNYSLRLTGSVEEHGLLVMSTGTTAVSMSSDAMSFQGDIYDPPQPYVQVPDLPPDAPRPTCALRAMQSGNNVSGVLCDRPAGFTGF
jgi:hypothetical protein